MATPPYYSAIRTTFAPEYEVPAEELLGLGRFNFLVGANNSGKSRFLRALLMARDLECKTSTDIPKDIRDGLIELRAGMTRLSEMGVERYGPIVEQNNPITFSLDGWHRESANPIKMLRDLAQALTETKQFAPVTRQGGSATPNQVKDLHERRMFHPAQSLVKRLETVETAEFRQRVYVPCLRGLRPLSVRTAVEGERDPYKMRTGQDYKIDQEKIFTGYEMYETTKNLLLGTKDERTSVDRYEAFLSNEVFSGRSVELIPSRNHDVLNISIGHEPERPLYNLGDGLQSILTLTFPAFTAIEPTLFFFEEPETHLHPGLQRRLIELFVTHPVLMRHQVFATTHSNHFLDLAADYEDCATFLFRKLEKDERFEIKTMGHHDRMVLQELGVRASSVFLTNAAIWVEGVTDRRYLREFLRCFRVELGTQDKPMREDVHYSLIELAGSDADHFAFGGEAQDIEDRIRVSRICANSFVLLDGDNEGKPRLEKLKNQLKEKLLVLTSKEIEHLLPLEALQAYAKHIDRSLDTTKLRGEDYQGKTSPLGAILDERLGSTRFTKDKTIKNKMGLCTFCVEWMRSNEWSLTEEARDLCKKVWDFIGESNASKVTA